MCGLTGYMYFNSPSGIVKDNVAIREMLLLQQHRGPDDSGIVGINTNSSFYQISDIRENKDFNKPVNLLFGFNRLSILDLTEKGHQPMFSPDNQIVLMMNGEIYNAFEHKKALIQKGHVFQSTTDTEVVLHLYMEYGMEGMINKLNGMFAIVIYDFKLNKLFLARDRFGIKPLYILKEKNRIAFSSEIKSFKALPEFRFELDKTQLDEFLLFRNVINNTLFKQIINCNPGSFWEVSVNGEYFIKTYYDINEEGCNLIDKSLAFCFLDQSLSESVKSQMMSDVKLGCQLSGGVDSSLVTYYASKHVKEDKLETISIVFDDFRFSEKRYIDYVASNLNLVSHQYTLDVNYYFDVLDKAIWHFEQPLNHPNTIGIYLLSQEAKKHVTVLLSGEGADECLAGYSRFLLSNSIIYFVLKQLQALKNNKDYLIEYLKYCIGYDNTIIMSGAFGNLYSAYTVYPGFNIQTALFQRKNIMSNLKGNSLLKQRKYEILTYLPDLLMRQDKMSMAHSIENRVPFLDNQLVSVALNLPPKLLVDRYKRKSELKKLLKQICAKYFSNDFAFRPKMGFAVPLQSFILNPIFIEKWQDEIIPDINNRGIFNTDRIKTIKTIDSLSIETIWLMYGFEKCMKQYVD